MYKEFVNFYNKTHIFSSKTGTNARKQSEITGREAMLEKEIQNRK